MPRPGTNDVSSAQARPAKIDGITGCFIIISAAPPSLASSRPPPPPDPISSRNEQSVSMISELTLMIIKSGTKPASPKA